MRSVPQPHTDYGFVDGMWKESRSPTESSDDLSSPRIARSASEPEVHPPHRPRPPRSKRPATANGSPSAPSSSAAHERTQSELSNFPYTSFLDPTGAPPQANKIPPSLKQTVRRAPQPCRKTYPPRHPQSHHPIAVITSLTYAPLVIA
ncbi:hypothetical protein BS47DRAFT_578333 [Hydnum rufescens UP504]|uniref:Uncharacterized protein n=1 Tax=Hydnum rufescens UP504 TaxID=1448309 RepID=A0A9P6AFU1_9AGAM|nr:hypothetical protein BS47DRAFT_578333 [Hydnum rufescens UP504]